MKNQSKEDYYIREVMMELGPDSPSANFQQTILSKLRAERTISVYNPVISSLGWKLIGGAIATLVIAVLFFLPSGDSATPLFNQLPTITIPKAGIKFPIISLASIDISVIAIQSLVIFSLFALVSIVFTLRKWQTS
ncbi:MAG: hypothetical protein ABJ333_16335 [Algoriphagus sp.]|uniref:hypothetical protein n=1 Tax=Algoriphagus sp. TaxID=1872435 RepID=UPI003276616E